MKLAINISALTNGDDVDLSVFDKFGEVKFFGELTKEEQRVFISDCDAVIVNKVEVDKELLDACPKLKYVGVFATGYNLIDIKECAKRGITVCNVPGYSTYAVSQHAFALLLYLYGRTGDYVRSVAEGDWIRSDSFCYFPWATRELYGKTFGVYGYGNIGRATAKIAEAFGMRVIVCTRSVPENCPYEVVTAEEIFKRSDVLSLHCPMTEKTKGLVNERTLSLMKPTAVIVNTARGGLIDECALAEALNGGRLYGACLDTVSVEPMRADNPLIGARNCIITPHIAWVPHETRARLVGLAAENLQRFLEGRPINVVNK